MAGKRPRKSRRSTAVRSHFFAQQLSGEEPPAAEEMAALVRIAMVFAQGEPWDWLDETQSFAFDHGGQRYYCSLTGALGEVLRLVAYPGDAGYGLFRRMASGEIQDSMEFYTACDLHYVEYVDRDELLRPDEELLRHCGHVLRSSQPWPVFRTVRRTYADWYPTAAEAEVLARSLLAAMMIIARMKRSASDMWADRDRIPIVTLDDNVNAPPVLAPVPRVTAGTNFWKPPVPDRERLEAILRQASGRAGVWEIGCRTEAIRIGQGNERPRFPQLAIATDAATGFAFPPVLASMDCEPGEVLVDALLQAIETSLAIPAGLRVASANEKACLDPVAMLLGVEVEVRKGLPALEALREAMFDKL